MKRTKCFSKIWVMLAICMALSAVPNVSFGITASVRLVMNCTPYSLTLSDVKETSHPTNYYWANWKHGEVEGGVSGSFVIPPWGYAWYASKSWGANDTGQYGQAIVTGLYPSNVIYLRDSNGTIWEGNDDECTATGNPCDPQQPYKSVPPNTRTIGVHASYLGCHQYGEEQANMYLRSAGRDDMGKYAYITFHKPDTFLYLITPCVKLSINSQSGWILHLQGTACGGYRDDAYIINGPQKSTKTWYIPLELAGDTLIRGASELAQYFAMVNLSSANNQYMYTAKFFWFPYTQKFYWKFVYCTTKLNWDGKSTLPEDLLSVQTVIDPDGWGVTLNITDVKPGHTASD